MAFEKKTFAPDAIEQARRLYEDSTASLDAVAAALGITRRTLESRIIEWRWPPRPATEAGKPARKMRRRTAHGANSKRANLKRTNPERAKAKPTKAKPTKAKPTKAKPTKAEPAKPRAIAGNQPQRACQTAGAEALAARVQRVVERELDAIDKILGAIGAADAAEAERSARTLASLARALKEVMRLAAPDEPAETDDDDPVPRDLDDFRRELARRIDALAAGGASPASGDG